MVETIVIARPAEEVFAYAVDFSRFPDWQNNVTAVRPEGDGPPGLGSRAVVARRVGPRTLSRQEEIVEFDRPRGWTVRGGGGPLTATATGSVEPLDEGQRSRVSLTLDFEGRGIWKLLIPLVVRRQARAQLPENARRLKEVLERPR
jgi:hypothetical protein